MPVSTPAPAPAQNENSDNQSGGSSSGGNSSLPPIGTETYCLEVMQGHRDWKIVSDTRTCTEGGTVIEACVLCSTQNVTENAPPTGHDKQYSNTTSSCDNGGNADWTCTCGAIGTDNVPAVMMNGAHRMGPQCMVMI